MATRTSRPTDVATRAPAAPPAAPSIRTSPATPPDAFPEIAAAMAQAVTTDGFDGAGPAPSRQPGQVTAGIGETLGKITHLWSYDSAVGVWVYLDGVGWRRLSPASEHGHSHLTVLATIATHANIPVYYNLDGSGQIDRLYV